MNRLITIPISHFCEKARWALDRAGVPYEERPHLQMLHWVAARRAGGGRTVPVLVCDEGALCDSTDILGYADRMRPGALYPSDPSAAGQVRRLERRLDEGLGPEGRRWMYHSLLGQKQLVRDYGATGVPAWQRRLLPVLWPVAQPVIRRYLDINAQTAAQSLDRIEGVFAEVADLLGDGRRFMVGDRFTAADLTFAALAAPLLVPELYGVPLPPPDLLPEPMRSGVRDFRDHPAGRFALRLYAEERS